MSEDAMAAVRPVPADFGKILFRVGVSRMPHQTGRALYQHVDPHEN
jgi:hypothetical protein